MRLRGKVLSVLLSAVIATSALVGFTTLAEDVEMFTADNVTTSNGKPDIDGGTIFHAWCLSFNTIANNMEDIKNAGYNTVQTSPPQDCKVGNNGQLFFTENWYYHYQPTSYKLGNYQLGSESEFKNMCNVAK